MFSAAIRILYIGWVFIWSKCTSFCIVWAQCAFLELYCACFLSSNTDLCNWVMCVPAILYGFDKQHIIQVYYTTHLIHIFLHFYLFKLYSVVLLQNFEWASKGSNWKVHTCNHKSVDFVCSHQNVTMNSLNKIK